MSTHTLNDTDADAPPVVHGMVLTPVGDEGHLQRRCPCGFQSKVWDPKEAPGISRVELLPCPQDRTVVGLVTLQMGASGIFDKPTATEYEVHLVRVLPAGGTPGPTLCDVDRFAVDSPGWSLGGGTTSPRIVHKPCPGCSETARRQYPNLPVSGSVGGREMAAHLGVEHKR